MCAWRREVQWTTVLLFLLFSINSGAVDVALELYTDDACVTASTTTPNITLGLNVCAITTGLESFILNPVPCTSGNVGHWVFDDLGCQGVSSNYYRGANNNNDCYATYFNAAMASIMLTCDPDQVDETQPSQPTATTSFAVGPVAAPTGSAVPQSGSPSSGGSASSPSSPSTTDSNSSSSLVSGWNSLDSGARIGIIVSLAVGVPPILLSLYLIALKKRKERRRRQEEEGNVPTQTHFPKTNYRDANQSRNQRRIDNFSNLQQGINYHSMQNAQIANLQQPMVYGGMGA